MHKRISRKIITYLFILLLLGTLNNKKFLDNDFGNNFIIEITSLGDLDDTKIFDELFDFNQQNLILLEKEKILEIIKNNKVVENYNIFKNYPSKLIVKLNKTEFLAVTQKEGVNFYIGSNGNLIKADEKLDDLPFVFGSVDIVEFLKLKKLIDNSVFDFDEIKNIYYFKSKRWDIETKTGLLIKLPKKNLIRSFDLLINIINSMDLNNIDVIDLRQKSQIILNG